MFGPVPSKDMQTPLPFSFFIPFSWKMDAQCAESNKKSIFRSLFFELSWKFIENWQFLLQKWPKMTITQKIKIGKIWNLIFLSIQPIPDLSCTLDHFWKKYMTFYFDVSWYHSYMERNKLFFFKSDQIYMKDLESAE